MNKYLTKIKKELSSFYEAAKKYDMKVAEANRRYQPEVAKEEILKLERDIEDDKKDAIDKIINIGNQAYSSVKKWGELDGSKINDNDVKLLKYKLSQDQFDFFVNKYKDNGTMCFILNQYAEKHNEKEKQDHDIYTDHETLDTSSIPTVDAKIEAYNDFVTSAIDLINSMLETGFGKGLNSPMLEQAVNTYGEPNQVNYNLLNVIGD